MKDIFITASEVGEFNFCRWCWWRHTLEGEVREITTQMQAGTQSHQSLAHSTLSLNFLTKVVAAMVALGVVMLLIAIVLMTLT